jgi:hypothetical protein
VPKLLGVNLLAMAGMSRMKDDMIVLLSNRHLALEKYQTELLLIAANSKMETPIERSLRNMDRDRNYPEWNDHYLRDVVSAQSAAIGGRLADLLVSTLPAALVSNPAFDFGAQEGSINLVQELAKRPNVDHTALDEAISQLLGNFGAHSRNAMRGILKASNQP